MNNLMVKCYSGYTNAEEPRSFEWGGVTREVTDVLSVWQEPGGRHFKVRTEDNKYFELCYNETEERWSLIG
ncbi:MAG: hypothetical protein A2144_09050 [Chloroflexi bacterium RBG_16_50_9]|nr:MAG: hypothetical protein A2144_09050 [Chloroflexi bacterium RBG_16_50_9]